MKKIYSFVLAAVAILSAASCQKEIVAPEADSNATAFSFVAEREADVAVQGVFCSVKTEREVRRGDKMYKFVESE